jgi:hypothetical protein
VTTIRFWREFLIFFKFKSPARACGSSCGACWRLRREGVLLVAEPLWAVVGLHVRDDVLDGRRLDHTGPALQAIGLDETAIDQEPHRPLGVVGTQVVHVDPLVVVQVFAVELVVVLTRHVMLVPDRSPHDVQYSISFSVRCIALGPRLGALLPQGCGPLDQSRFLHGVHGGVPPKPQDVAPDHADGTREGDHRSDDGVVERDERPEHHAEGAQQEDHGVALVRFAQLLHGLVDLFDRGLAAVQLVRRLHEVIIQDLEDPGSPVAVEELVQVGSDVEHQFAKVRTNASHRHQPCQHWRRGLNRDIRAWWVSPKL